MDVVSISRERMQDLRRTKTTAKYNPNGIQRKRCAQLSCVKENLITKLVTNYVPDGGTEKRYVYMGFKKVTKLK